MPRNNSVQSNANRSAEAAVSPSSRVSSVPAARFSLGGWGLVLACLLLAPLLLPTRPMWDDVIMRYAFASEPTTGLQAMYADMMWSTNWYLTWAALQGFAWLQSQLGVPLVASFKLLTVALALGIAVEAARITRLVLPLDDAYAPNQARWVLPLVAAFPMWFVFYCYFCMSGHLLGLWLGLLGYRWWMHGAAWRRWLGAAVVTAGFQLASLCVFLPALALAEWLLHPERRRQAAWRGAVMLGLSVLVYAATRVVWPPVELYEGYNKLVLPTSGGALKQYAKYTALFATWGLLLLPALAVWAWVSLQVSVRGNVSGRGSGERSLNAHPAFVAAVLGMLMGAACLPYVMVGVGGPLWVLRLGAESSYSAALVNTPDASVVGLWYGGWHARQAMVLMLPLCMAVVWVAGRVAVLRGQRWGASVIGLSLALSAALLLPGYWAKLQRAAYETSVINHLRSVPAPPGGLVRVALPPDADFALDTYEANYLLFEAYGTARWVAFAAPERLHAFALAKRDKLLATPPEQHALVGMAQVMSQYDWSRACESQVWLAWPPLSVWDVLWRAHVQPRSVAPAQALRTASTCPDAPPQWRGATVRPGENQTPAPG